MKTNIFILISTLCTFLQFAHGQETTKRPVIWIKGFTSEEQGSPGWQRYDTLFSRQFYMKGFRPTYLSNRPISAITSQFRTEVLDSFNLSRSLDTSFSDLSNSILIGHSMGGLIARTWEQQYRQRFQKPNQNSNPEIGGIITIATPNQGSMANRDLKNGVLQDAIDRSVNLLADPLATTSINDKILSLPSELTSILTASTLFNAIGYLKDGINLTIAQTLNRKDPFIPAFDDMIPNSSFLDSLNSPNQTGTIPPIINIQCSANFPSFYRVFFSQFSDPLKAETDKYDDSYIIKFTDILAATIFFAATKETGTIKALEILGSGNDTMNTKLIRDPMMIYAMAASKIEYPALRTWRSIKYDFPISFSVLIGSAQFSYLPYSQTTQYIRRSEENGVTDGKYLFRYVTSQEGEVVPVYRVKEVRRDTNTTTGVIKETIVSYMGDDGTLSEDVQEQPYNRLRTERVIGVTHVSVQNNRFIRQKLVDIFNDPLNQNFFVQSRVK